MFVFGTPEEIATMTVDSVAMQGPGLSYTPFDEQTTEELRVTLTICRIALKEGRRNGLNREALDVLLLWHDEAFKALAEASEDFCEMFKRTRYDYPRPKSRKNKAFYRAIVDEASSES